MCQDLLGRIKTDVEESTEKSRGVRKDAPRFVSAKEKTLSPFHNTASGDAIFFIPFNRWFFIHKRKTRPEACIFVNL